MDQDIPFGLASPAVIALVEQHDTKMWASLFPFLQWLVFLIIRVFIS